MSHIDFGSFGSFKHTNKDTKHTKSTLKVGGVYIPPFRGAKYTHHKTVGFKATKTGVVD